MDLQGQIADLINPLLLAVVGFFLLRLVKTLDELNKDSQRRTIEQELLKADITKLKEECGILKRDQVSIWRRIDDIRGYLNDRHAYQDRVGDPYEAAHREIREQNRRPSPFRTSGEDE